MCPSHFRRRTNVRDHVSVASVYVEFLVYVIGPQYIRQIFHRQLLWNELTLFMSRFVQVDLCFKAVGVGLPDVMESCIVVAGFPKSALDIFLGTIVLPDQTSQKPKGPIPFHPLPLPLSPTPPLSIMFRCGGVPILVEIAG